MAFSRSRSIACSSSRSWFFCCMRSRASAICCSSSARCRWWIFDFAPERRQPHFQLLRFLLALRDALLDGRALLHLRFQAAAGALRFHVAAPPARGARRGELLLGLIALGLQRGVLLLLDGHLFGERRAIRAEATFRSSADLAASRSSIRNLPDSKRAQAGIHLGLQLAVALAPWRPAASANSPGG